MGNRATRKAVCKRLKELNLDEWWKPWKPLRCKRGVRQYKKKTLRKLARKGVDWAFLLEMLKYDIGDIIHDCDGLNHRISGYDFRYRLYRKYDDHIKKYKRKSQPEILCLDLSQFYKDGTNYLTCGCSIPEPGLPKEYIESFYRNYTVEMRGTDWEDDWLGRIDKALNVDNESIVDEDGILLKKFRADTSQ